MFSYIWPIALVVLANTVYQICAKSVPEKMDPFASLTVTYLIAAVVSAVLFFILNKTPNLIREYSKLNWAPFLLGIAVVGLEVGFIFAYKAGWQIGNTAIVSSAALAVILFVIGSIFYKEPVSWNKVTGIVICLIGLFFINLKK